MMTLFKHEPFDRGKHFWNWWVIHEVNCKSSHMPNKLIIIKNNNVGIDKMHLTKKTNPSNTIKKYRVKNIKKKQNKIEKYSTLCNTRSLLKFGSIYVVDSCSYEDIHVVQHLIINSSKHKVSLEKFTGFKNWLNLLV